MDCDRIPAKGCITEGQSVSYAGSVQCRIHGSDAWKPTKAYLSTTQKLRAIFAYATAQNSCQLSSSWQLNCGRFPCNRSLLFFSASLHFTYPIVYLTVGAPRMIGQPLFSILLCFRPFEGLQPTLILCTLLRCLPISFCLPLLLPPCTVPCRIIFASPVDLVLCPYHLSFCFFTVVRRSS